MSSKLEPMALDEGGSLQKCPLTSLPSELINSIISFLRPQEVVSVAKTCRQLYVHATADIIWQPLVQENVPGVQLTSPFPMPSFLDLYKAHDPHWFLPRYKIWFGDSAWTGSLMMVRYDPRRGCIEGYRLLAINRKSHDVVQMPDQVVLRHFDPLVRLHLDKPVLQLDALTIDNFLRSWASVTPSTTTVVEPVAGSSTSNSRSLQPGTAADSQPTTDSTGGNAWLPSMPDKPNRFVFAETHMGLGNSLFGNFMHARTLDPHEPLPVESMPWPPYTVVSHGPRTMTIPFIPRNETPTPLCYGGRPHRRGELCERAFRLRTWTELGGRPIGMLGPSMGRELLEILGENAMSTDRHMHPVRVGEQITTFATLDPALYTPTHAQPWRGIWVGDYCGHGCEFILIDQPDNKDDDGVGSDLARLDGETEDDFEQRKSEDTVWRGQLRGVKLTGDPNVPRGAITFIANDLNDYEPMLTVPEDAEFKGARIVNGMGQVANEGFSNARFIETKLIITSHNRLAIYWVELDHISCLERVDIDQFLAPA